MALLFSNFFLNFGQSMKICGNYGCSWWNAQIHSCYAADWGKHQCHLLGNVEHLLIYQGRQLCYDNQAPSVLVNFKLIEISFSLTTHESFVSCFHASAYAKILENWNLYWEHARLFIYFNPKQAGGGGGGIPHRLVLPSTVLKR